MHQNTEIETSIVKRRPLKVKKAWRPPPAKNRTLVIHQRSQYKNRVTNHRKRKWIAKRILKVKVEYRIAMVDELNLSPLKMNHNCNFTEPNLVHTTISSSSSSSNSISNFSNSSSSSGSGSSGSTKTYKGDHCSVEMRKGGRFQLSRNPSRSLPSSPASPRRHPTASSPLPVSPFTCPDIHSKVPHRHSRVNIGVKRSRQQQWGQLYWKQYRCEGINTNRMQWPSRTSMGLWQMGVKEESCVGRGPTARKQTRLTRQVQMRWDQHGQERARNGQENRNEGRLETSLELIHFSEIQ